MSGIYKLDRPTPRTAQSGSRASASSKKNCLGQVEISDLHVSSVLFPVSYYDPLTAVVLRNQLNTDTLSGQSKQTA